MRPQPLRSHGVSRNARSNTQRFALDFPVILEASLSKMSSTPPTYKNCGEAGIQSGDAVLYDGRQFWAKPMGNTVYLFTSPSLKGKHAHAPRVNSVTKVSPATTASATPSPTTAAASAASSSSSPHTPLKFKNCGEAGIASGDKVAYHGREFWAKPSGNTVLLFDTPTLKGAHVHAPNVNSVTKASRTTTTPPPPPPPIVAAVAAAPTPTTPDPARKLTFDESTMHVDAIDPRTRELLHPTLLKLTKKTLGTGSSGVVVEGVLANEVTDEVQRVAVKQIALAGDDVSAPRREIDALIAAADIDSIAPLLCWSLDRATKTLSIFHQRERECLLCLLVTYCRRQGTASRMRSTAMRDARTSTSSAATEHNARALRCRQVRAEREDGRRFHHRRHRRPSGAHRGARRRRQARFHQCTGASEHVTKFQNLIKARPAGEIDERRHRLKVRDFRTAAPRPGWVVRHATAVVGAGEPRAEARARCRASRAAASGSRSGAARFRSQSTPARRASSATSGCAHWDTLAGHAGRTRAVYRFVASRRRMRSSRHR